jgi:hypothetical protein
MKRKRILSAAAGLIGLAGLLGAPPARAQVEAVMQADIPFSFHAGDAQLPAGKYRIQAPEDSYGRVMEIYGPDGQAALFQVIGTESRTPSPDSELVFHKYGDNYYLWKISETGSVNGDELPVSHSEKSLRRELYLGERSAEIRVLVLPKVS